MKITKLIPWLIILLLGFAMVSCERFADKETIPGIDESLVFDGIRVRILAAEIRNSYSVYYIMHYPAENQVFYAVTASLEGFADPKTTLEWGQKNLQLISGNSVFELVYAQWSVVDEDIQYKAGEDLTYRYHFFFSVPREVDYEQYTLQLPEDVKINTASILSAPQIQAAGKTDEQPLETAPLEEGLGQQATIGGGSDNQASAYHTTIAGGNLNQASVAYASIGGGRENYATNLYSTVAGGYGNTASGRDAAIGGGSRNTASFYHTTIAGGIRNQANASESTIAGGAYNLTAQPYAVVGGGSHNAASGTAAVVAGGAGNLAREDQSTVSGGLGNQANGSYAVIGGGYGNTASGDYSTIAGGAQNQAGGDYSLAAGRRSFILPLHPGAILLSDSTDADFKSVNADEFGVRATGGIRFVTGVDENGEPIAGAILPEGSGSWSNLSSRQTKDNLVPIDHAQILASVLGLEISAWSYTSEDPAIRHIGPMAEDFYAAFGTGVDAHHISSIDADGISLAAIQEVTRLVEAQNDNIAVLEARITTLETRTNWLVFMLVASMASILAGLLFHLIARSYRNQASLLGNTFLPPRHGTKSKQMG